MEEEKIKKFTELKEMLEERIKSLEAELEGTRIILDFISNLLVEKSFKRANEIAKPVSPTPPEAKPKPAPIKKEVKTIPLKTGAGELLANIIHVEDGVMRIVPAPDKKFNVNTPPFTAFLVNRVLEKMRERDRELTREGRIMPDEVFSYSIEKDGDMLQEIIIRNFNFSREREIRSAARWTFEKMYEKMRSPA